MAHFAAHSNKGPLRETNQDACCVEVAQTRFGEVVMAVVCDGVGGLSQGELASSCVARRFARWFERDLPPLIDGMRSSFEPKAVEDAWKALLGSINRALYAYGVRSGGLLGTTVTAALSCDGDYVVGHVGDCRLYRVNDRGVRQITTDQTLVARQVANGILTPGEARTHPRRNVILQAVGASPSLYPLFYRGRCDANDLFVLCSDGAYRKAKESDLGSVFGNGTQSSSKLGRACRALIARDLSRGETDNLTVACFGGGLLSHERRSTTQPTHTIVAGG